MSKNPDLTYYQKKKRLDIKYKKDYNKNNKKRLREQARDKYRSLPEEDKNKIENMGRIGIIICLKKKKKTDTRRIPKKLSRGKRKIFLRKSC